MFTAVIRSALILCLMNLVGVQTADAQAPLELPDWVYRTWETGDGLPDNAVTGVTQTDDGYVWVATFGGLLRFNGDQFLNLPVIEMPGVPSRVVWRMFQDSRSRLWLSMERGSLLCVESDSVRAYTEEEGLIRQRSRTLAEDADGGIWVATTREVFWIMDDQVEKVATRSELGVDRITSLSADAEGSIWLAADAKLYQWLDGRFTLERTLPAESRRMVAGARSGLWIAAGEQLYRLQPDGNLEDQGPLPTRAAPSCLYEDSQGALWIGTRTDGLFRKTGEDVEKVPTSHHHVNSVYEDREGDFWVGTIGGGLNQIRPRMLELIGRSEGLPVESVQSVTEDAGGRLWVASHEGELARRNHDGLWEVVTTTPEWPGGQAACVAADPEGGVWVGTSGEGLKHGRGGVWQTWKRSDGLPSDTLRSLLPTRSGDLWLATRFPDRVARLRDGQLSSIKQPNRLGAIRAMAEGTDGTIWIGTSFGQLFRVIDDSLVREPAVQEQFTLSIRSLHVSPDGALWIGYAGDGLGMLKDGVHHRLTTGSGLRDDFISQLLSDETGRLWMLGNRGLSEVRIPQLQAVMDGSSELLQSRVFGPNDGLPTLLASRDFIPASWRMQDGRLSFATRSGLLVVSPERMPAGEDPPPVVLERVAVDGQVVAAYGTYAPLRLFGTNACLDLRRPAKPALRLPPGHRKVEFRFAGLSYASPENVRFRYRLSRFDEKWIESGSARSAIYPRLAAGDYEFRVQACSSAGVWNETGAMLAFTVTPFVWETWWFRLVSGFTILAISWCVVYILARRRYRRKLARLEARRALEEERTRIARDIHDHLGSNLTRITLLSQPADDGLEDAATEPDPLEQIHSTAHELTQAMGEVVWAVNPDHDTFDSLVNYLTHYAHDFLNVAGIRCRLQMPLSLPEHVLSADLRHNLFLAFKEALNNVVKHAHATEVRISLVLEPHRFTLLVADNGCGPGSADTGGSRMSPGGDTCRTGHGNGLVNMKNRLEVIGGACEWQGEPEGGTRVTFVVPLKHG